VIDEELDRIDSLAATGTSPVHRASPLSRVLAAALTVAAILVAEEHRPIAVVAALLLVEATIAWAGPIRLLLAAFTPLPFFIVLALLRLGSDGENAEMMSLLLFRAGASAMALVLLLSTTTFVDVLRVLGPLLPRDLAATLAVLYRSLFILLRHAGHVGEVAWTRGVFPVQGPIVGGLLLHAFERMENVACVMHVRGVDLPDPDRADAFRPRPLDLLPLARGVAALALSLASLRP